MRYAITHKTTYAYADVAPVCHNQVRLAPRNTPLQSCRELRIEVSPEPSTKSRRLDYFGNRVDFFSLNQAHRGLTITSHSVVDVAGPTAIALGKTPAWEAVARQLLADRTREGLLALQLSLPSPRVATSPELAAYARKSFTPGRPLGEAARDLTRRIYSDFEFDSSATTVHTRPEQLLALRRGVCQDFAHLAIGCLRSLGLPARYVSGYLRTAPPPGKPRLKGADASHAWAGIYCGAAAGWIDFDPTNDAIPSDAHITVGWGRDYGDISPIQGVFVGGGAQTMTVGVDVAPITELGAPADE